MDRKQLRSTQPARFGQNKDHQPGRQFQAVALWHLQNMLYGNNQLIKEYRTRLAGMGMAISSNGGSWKARNKKKQRKQLER